jgi:hypothetical protein
MNKIVIQMVANGWMAWKLNARGDEEEIFVFNATTDLKFKLAKMLEQMELDAQTQAA